MRLLLTTLLITFPIFSATCVETFGQSYGETTFVTPIESTPFQSLSKEQKLAKIKAKSSKIETLLVSNLNHSRIGVHFNLHGGSAQQYVEAGGILKSQNNPESYTNHRDAIPTKNSLEATDRVYFFDLAKLNLHQVLEQKPSFFQTRYGNTLMLFDLQRFVDENAEVVKKQDNIYIEFEKSALNDRVAIPVEYFVTEPIKVFESTNLIRLKRTDRLTETYLALNKIETAILKNFKK